MAREIEVVYENGVFKPTVPVRLEEGHRLRLWIPWEPDGKTPEQVLSDMEEMQKAYAELSDEDKAFLDQAWKRGS